MSTAFTRVKNTWHRIAPFAETANPAILIEWEENKQEFKYTDGRCLVPRGIALSTMVNMARHFTSNVQDALESLLPTSFNWQTLNTLSMKDNLSGTPFSKQQPNLAIINPLIDSLYDALLKTEGKGSPLIKRLIRSYLEKEQKFLQALLLAIALTIGIPPRAGQLANIRYMASSDGIECRNIFLRNNIVSLAISQQQRNSHKCRALVWTFPPEVGNILVFYLSVVRPVTIKLLQEAGKKLHSDHHSHLFIYNHARRPGRLVWSAVHAANILEEETQSYTGHTLTLTHLYQFMTSIYKRHFPLLVVSRHVKPATSIANLQADHDQTMSDFNYGLTTTLPSGMFMTNSSFSMFVERSAAWHATIGMCPAYQSVLENARSVHDVRKRINKILALHHARWLVVHSYDFSGTDEKSARRTQAIELLQSAQFLDFPIEPVSVQVAFVFLLCSFY